MLKGVRSLFIDLVDAFGIRIPILVGLMVASGVLEGLALSLALPLLNELGAPASQSEFMAAVSSIPSLIGLPEGPASVGALMFILLIATASIITAQGYLAASLQTAFASQWQRRAFTAALSAEMAYLDQCRPGEVVSAIVSEAHRAGIAVYYLIVGLAAILTLIIYMILALLISWQATLFLVVLGAVLLGGTWPLLSRAQRLGVEVSRALESVQLRASETVGAAKLIKAISAGDAAGRLFAEASEGLATANFKTTFDLARARVVFEYGGALGIALLLIIGPSFFGLEVATMLVVLALFVRLLPRAAGLQQSFQALASLLPAYRNLADFHAKALASAEPMSDGPLPACVRSRAPELKLRNATINRGGRAVVKDVSLTIPAGTTAAFVGASGSGKSTIVEALLGLVKPDSGAVLVNGYDLRQLPLPAWRKAIGFVGQDTLLLSGTIADNVRLGNDVPAADIDLALRRAAADFVFALPVGPMTLVGDRGSRLSGGERQRIGIARALALPRLVYVLDEATSALDSETESRLVEHFAALARSATVIIVAHRFSAIRGVDMIHVVDDGRIVETGSWRELDMPGTRFWALHQLQSAERSDPAKSG